MITKSLVICCTSLAGVDPELFFHSHQVLYQGTGIGLVPAVPIQSMTWAEGVAPQI